MAGRERYVPRSKSMAASLTLVCLEKSLFFQTIAEVAIQVLLRCRELWSCNL